MQISIQLDDEHAQKLAYIQQTTQENTLETIQQAIENSENILHSLLSEKNDHC